MEQGVSREQRYSIWCTTSETATIAAAASIKWRLPKWIRFFYTKVFRTDRVSCHTLLLLYVLDEMCDRKDWTQFKTLYEHAFILTCIHTDKQIRIVLTRLSVHTRCAYCTTIDVTPETSIASDNFWNFVFSRNGTHSLSTLKWIVKYFHFDWKKTFRSF